MVAIIKTGHSVQRILNYNENKVREGVAYCIGAENFPLDHDQMTFDFKDRYFKNQLSLNEKVTRNSVHISLNFHESESRLSQDKLCEIARKYMTGIGFGDQPYLVYQHLDAGHPHIHIVSIKVRSNGKRIDMHNIGRNQSETSRLAIEKDFGLVPASAGERQLPYKIVPIEVGKVEYGKTETRKAIQNILDKVVTQYRYCSLPELNAILKQFNVRADRGTEDSRVFQKNGLLYRIIGPDGKPVGVPIKASLFYNKPTLKFLEGRYAENATKRSAFKSRIKNAIDRSLLNGPVDLIGLISKLERQGIQMVLRKNENNILYGITYVDHRTKCVFNGRTLGTAYAAKMIQERCKESVFASVVHGQKNSPSATHGKEQTEAILDFPLSAGHEVLDALLKVEQGQDYMPYELRQSKRKRKKRKNL